MTKKGIISLLLSWILLSVLAVPRSPAGEGRAWQAEEMFTALKKLGVDTELAIYPNEGHGVSHQPHHALDCHQRSLAWFDKYLK